MIKILFEFIEIKHLKEKKFKIDNFLNTFNEPQNYLNFKINLERINIPNNSNSLFKFILIDIQNEIEKRYQFLTFYSNKFNLFLINVEIYNKEKIFLLDFLNTLFIDFFFRTYTPYRSQIWNFLKNVNIIELEIIADNKIIDYLEVDDKILLKKIEKNLENYPVFTSYISFKINDKTIALNFYGNRIDLPEYFDIYELDLLINKMSSIFLEQNEISNI